MIAALQGWIFHLICTALFAAAAVFLTPKGAVKRIVGFACGLLLLLVLLRPLSELDFLRLGLGFSDYEAELRERTEEYRAKNQETWETLIAEELESYIESRAEELGCPCDAEVTVEAGEDGTPRVTGAVLTAPEKNRALSDYLARELGIAEECQSWRTT